MGKDAWYKNGNAFKISQSDKYFFQVWIYENKLVTIRWNGT